MLNGQGEICLDWLHDPPSKDDGIIFAEKLAIVVVVPVYDVVSLKDNAPVLVRRGNIESSDYERSVNVHKLAQMYRISRNHILVICHIDKKEVLDLSVL